jgi:tetratricopeptide (TPR) repeat protein
MASVIGRSFAVPLLAIVSGQDAHELELPLASMQRAEIAFPRRGPDLEYVFKHVSMREVAYNTLVQKRRQALHLATARAMAELYPADEYVEIIAYHYNRTEEHREAAEWLERAGDRAAGVYANETAMSNYLEARRRLGLIGEEKSAIARVDEKLGGVLGMVGRYDEALEVLERAVEVYREVHDLEAVGRATARIGRTHRYQGTLEEGITRIQPLLGLLTSSGPSSGLASLHLALAYLYFGSSRYEETLEAAERAGELARAVGDEQILAGAEMRRGTALHILGQVEEGCRVLATSVPLAEAAGDLDVLSIALNNLADSYLRTGELDQSRRYLERALEMAERVGNTPYTGFIMVNLAELLNYLGEWDEGGKHLERGAEVVRAAGASWWAAYPPLHRGYLRLRQGRWEDASDALEEAISLADPIGDLQALEYANWFLGEVELMQGRPDAARARLEPLIPAEGPYTACLRTTLAWAYLEQGEVDRAEETAARGLAIAWERQNRLYVPGLLQVQGMVLSRQGKWDGAERVFAEAISLAQSMPYPYAEARALHEYGAMHIRKGEPEKARERLEEALAIFRRIGAKKDVERTEQALRELEVASSNRVR